MAKKTTQLIKNIKLLQEKQSEENSIISMRGMKDIDPANYFVCAAAFEKECSLSDFVPTTKEKLLFTEKARFFKKLSKACASCFGMSAEEVFEKKEKGETAFNAEEMQKRKQFLSKLLNDSDDIEAAKLIIDEEDIAHITLNCKSDDNITVDVPAEFNKVARRVQFNVKSWHIRLNEDKNREQDITKIKIYE